VGILLHKEKGKGRPDLIGKRQDKLGIATSLEDEHGDLLHGGKGPRYGSTEGGDIPTQGFGEKTYSRVIAKNGTVPFLKKGHGESSARLQKRGGVRRPSSRGGGL